MSRLTIELSDHQHKSLKALAALNGKTIRQYAIERLFPAEAPGEASNGDEDWAALEALLKRRIAAGLAGDVSSRSMADIIRAELGAKGTV